MALGPFAFEAVGFSYAGMQHKTETKWASLSVAQGFDQLQWTGPKSETITIKGALFPEEFGGMGSLSRIRQAAIAGTPLPLVIMTGDIIGTLWVIETVSDDQSFILASGLPRKDEYQIGLKRYAGGLSAVTSALVGLF